VAGCTVSAVLGLPQRPLVMALAGTHTRWNRR
jgi:hypothetical protein